MTPRFDLTALSESTEIEHGMPFVIKWKNPTIGFKVDLWIGVHVPESIARGMPKFKGNEKPSEPKYSMYLPGRNTYRMIERKCIYPLSAYTPEQFHEDGLDYGDVYERIYNIAEKTDEIEFWSRYAKTEYATKDRTDKVPSIDFSAPGRRGQEADVEMDDASEFSEDNGAPSNYFARGYQTQKEPAKRGPVSTARFTTSKKIKTVSFQGQQFQQQQQEPDGEELVDIYIGSGGEQQVFHLTRNKINRSSFLRGLIQDLGGHPYIFHPYLHQMTPAEFEAVYACLSQENDISSDLVSVDGDAEEILGNTEKLTKIWMLKDVLSIGDLNALIPRLGTMYSQACLLGLTEMADAVISKVQVAWNVYGRVAQLPLFLDFIESVMPNLVQQSSRRNAVGGFYAPSSFGFGQESWIVGFLAETMMLYTIEIPQRFWGLMTKYPFLQEEVMAHRAALCRGKLIHQEKTFMQRGPLTEASFVIPAKKDDNDNVEEEQELTKEGEATEAPAEAPAEAQAEVQAEAPAEAQAEVQAEAQAQAADAVISKE